MGGVLQGKVALVTGGSRGIGRAIARRLARSGALVAINYVSNVEAVQEVVAGIEADGGQAFAVRTELGPPGSAEALAAAVEAALVRRAGAPELDIVVNNVGNGDYARIVDTTEEAYDATFARNTRVPFFLVKALHDRLRPGGSVVNISSTGVRLNLPEIVAYNMAKAALESFTRTLANELGPRGVRVNSVAPGFILTDYNAADLADAAHRQQVEALTAMRRIGAPDDIAEVVHDLVSPGWSFVTGQLIEVSGGYNM
jgi:NAD(P)-dependent dehydrogenase (short-subunit alcohol dehydrogenase family)